MRPPRHWLYGPAPNPVLRAKPAGATRIRLNCGAGSDKRKQSLYFPEEMLKEIQAEANRQDRSLSWIVQKSWKISRKEIMKYPSVNEFPGGAYALFHGDRHAVCRLFWSLVVACAQEVEHDDDGDTRGGDDNR